LCEGLGQFIDAHENGGSMNGDPNTMNGEDEDLDPRGSNGGNMMNEGSNNGTGANDRRRRHGAADRLSRSRATSNFAQRWPDAMRISIRG
jgi:hypothetical protein